MLSRLWRALRTNILTAPRVARIAGSLAGRGARRPARLRPSCGAVLRQLPTPLSRCGCGHMIATQRLTQTIYCADGRPESRCESVADASAGAGVDAGHAAPVEPDAGGAGPGCCCVGTAVGAPPLGVSPEEFRADVRASVGKQVRELVLRPMGASRLRVALLACARAGGGRSRGGDLLALEVCRPMTPPPIKS